MAYLTEEEKKMPNEAKLLQYVLGIQSCKTKGEVVEMLREIQEEAFYRGLVHGGHRIENGRIICEGHCCDLHDVEVRA